MEYFETMGKVVRILRDEMNISQEQLALLSNVSKTVIAKIESGKRKPTKEQLIILSNKLNFDLLGFSAEIYNYKTLEHYILANKLTKLIKSHSINEITEIVNNNPIFMELNYGITEVLKIYCETLVLIIMKKNINEALEKCLNFFQIENLNIISFKPKVAMPEQYYSMILNLTYCLNYKNEVDSVLIIYDDTIKFLENLYFSDSLPTISVNSFYKKYYIICLNNLADSYFQLKNFNFALNFCNKAIENSIKHNVLNVLPQLAKLKVEILYNLGSIEKAYEIYIQLKCFCQLINNNEYFETATTSFKISYPKLFEVNNS